MNTAFTAEQWAAAGEHAFRHYMADAGLIPTDAQIVEARASAAAIGAGDPDTTRPDATP